MHAADPANPANPATGEPVVPADGFINDADAAESGGDDDEEEGKPADKKAGRRKIKIEFIQDKSRRHITFSKRKAGQFLPAIPFSSSCSPSLSTRSMCSTSPAMCSFRWRRCFG